MENEQAESGPARACRWGTLAIWLAVAMGVGLVVGCISGGLQQSGKSLFMVQSLGMGALVAILLVGAGGMTRRQPPWWSALIAGATAVVVQHAWLYRAVMAARRAAVDKQAAVELFKPGWSSEGFFSYLWNWGRQPNGAAWQLAEWPNAALWAIDACLLITAAVAIVHWSGRSSGPTASPSSGEVAPDDSGP